MVNSLFVKLQEGVSHFAFVWLNSCCVGKNIARMET